MLTMNADQLALVRSNFAAVALNPEGFTSAFYDRLFETAPAVRPLFPEDLAEQRVKLARELAVIVDAAADPERMRPRLQRLGARHLGYGAAPAHYGVVGAVLIDTLAETLGDAFTDDARAAWTAAIALIANAMLEGAAMAESESAA